MKLLLVSLLFALVCGKSVYLGGPGGGPFDDTYLAGGGANELTSVVAYTVTDPSNYFYGYVGQFSNTWTNPDNSTHTGTHGIEPYTPAYALTLRPGERFATIGAYSDGRYLVAINITTNQGRALTTANYRESSSKYQEVTVLGQTFYGFIGRSGFIMDAIGFNASDNTCGDGVISGPEQCDNGEDNGYSCCTKECLYASSSTVCRPAAGACDIPESCTGSSSTCPPDVLVAEGTPCGQLFGACDVEISRSCDGVDATCYSPPAAPALFGQTESWKDFNVISFNNYRVNGGDVEGRLAVRRNASLNSFTVGLQLSPDTDGIRPVTVLVGNSVYWSAGSLYPSDKYPNGQPEAFLVSYYALTGAAASYIPAVSNYSSDAQFGQAQTYYETVQAYLAGLPYDATAHLQYGDGLSITCNDPYGVLYHLAVDAATFSQVNWYSTNNCNFVARWIIDITGTGNVTFKGAPFPGIVERVVYNILGSGKTVYATNGVAGHIFAPANRFVQPVGVTYGLVIAGDIPIAKQNNKPNCQNFQPSTITTKLRQAIQVGNQIIYVVDYPDLIVGDLICIDGDCKKVVEATNNNEDESKRGGPGGAIKVDSPFTASHSADTFATTTVTDFTNRNATLNYPSETVAPTTNPFGPSSASLFTVSLFSLLAALLFVQ